MRPSFENTIIEISKKGIHVKFLGSYSLKLSCRLLGFFCGFLVHVKDEWSEEAKVVVDGSNVLVDGSNVLVSFSQGQLG